MNSDTPETDAAEQIRAGSFTGSQSRIVTADFARKLERERNTLETRHAAVMLLTQSVVDENTQLRKVCDELSQCAGQLGYTSSDDPNWIRRSESAIELYNQLPHVIQFN